MSEKLYRECCICKSTVLCVSDPSKKYVCPICIDETNISAEVKKIRNKIWEMQGIEYENHGDCRVTTNDYENYDYAIKILQKLLDYIDNGVK